MRMLIALVPLFIAASAMAAEDLCTLQLQKLADQSALGKPASANAGASPAVAKLIEEAKAYQQKGDLENCERTGQKALTMIKQSGGGSATQ